uniref:Uncharacterized protein n=1 Tax=Tanacetum cinerariifolium TaxID=118510 RepID=A0A6L2NNU8_TANCI|nr:hypothetical protein [Tanacetum cinerariifolium]
MMDDPNITMEEYVRLEEEKARKRRKVFNWETAKYGKIWYDEDVYDLRSVETEFPAIVFYYNLTSNETLFCEPTVSSLKNNEIDFRISFDEFDDEDYTVIFDKNSFSYKIIYVNDLKTDSENDNEKVNMPSFPSLKTKVSCIDDLNFFKDFENEFPAIVYNDALTVNENTQRLNELLEASHDKINKVFIMKSFVMELNVNIVAWNYLVNGMLFNLIKNLYVPFGIPFDPKWYYKDGDCTRMLWRPRDQRLKYLRFEGVQYTEGDTVDYESRGRVCSLAEPGGGYLILEARCIAGRSRAPEKMTVTDLFYLSGMDVGSVNVPYLLAMYLRLFTPGRKQGVMISGSQFVFCIAKHFKLLTKERLWGLTVASGPERQPDVAAGAPEAGVANEGALTIPTPIQEDMHEIRGAPGEQRDVLDSMARDFSRTKAGNKFSIIVREYVTDPITLSKSRAEMRRESVYKSVEAQE